jgi:hypothetical protein
MPLPMIATPRDIFSLDTEIRDDFSELMELMLLLLWLLRCVFVGRYPSG